MKYFVSSAIILVAVAVIGAFFVIGSPAQQRLARFDEQRISDLQAIESMLSVYYSLKGSVPKSLSELNGFQNSVLPRDPQTGASYEYVVLGSDEGGTAVNICMNFNLANNENEDKSGQGSIWHHGAGRDCFDFYVEKNTPRIPTSITVKPAR